MKKQLFIISAVLTIICLVSCRKLNPIIPVDTLCLPCQNKVIFADKNLDTAVRNALGKGACDICANDLANVSNLVIQGQVSNYAGFGGLVNLKTLKMSNCAISDFNFLAGLAQVSSIDVDGCSVSGFAGFDNDANPVTVTVKYLNMSGCDISDISGLAKMQGLTWLSVSNNNITGVTALAGKPYLVEFYASGNKIASLSGLDSDSALRTIDARSNSITGISPIAGLTNLRILNLSSNFIANINAVSGLTALQSLDIGFNNITDIKPLAGLLSLAYLAIWHNEVTAIDSADGDTSPLGPLVRNSKSGGIGNKTNGLLISYYNGLPGPTYTAAELADINYLISAGVLGLQYAF